MKNYINLDTISTNSKKYDIHTGALESAGELLNRNNKKFIFTSFSAAIYWGFSPYIDRIKYIAIPSDYKIKRKHTNGLKFIKLKKAEKDSDIVTIKLDNKLYKLHTQERTLVDIIIAIKGEYNDQNIELIYNFFKKVNYDKKYLYELAIKNNIYNEIKCLEVLYE